MKAIIAGFNIDTDLISKLPKNTIATPETISAAYARISRSPKSVDKLRIEATNEVEKARKSNENIVFDMGHSSIAEHAVFNIDVIGISRYLAEFIQKSRLASFTEKSQRYVTLKGDFYIPEEIKKSNLEKDFLQLIEEQNKLYFELFEKATNYLKENNFEGAKRELEGRAKEDARYILSLSTLTQMGITINARNLERLLRRLDACDLIEAKKLAAIIEEKVKNIAPSLVKYTKTDDFYSKNLLEFNIKAAPATSDVNFLNCTDDIDTKVLTALAYEKSNCDYQTIANYCQNLSSEEKQSLFNQVFTKIKSYHAVPKAFEAVDFEFELKMSASCFAQVKRHRMSTILKKSYLVDEDIFVPELLQKIDAEKSFKKIAKQSQVLFYKLELLKQGLGNYALTNAHKTLVYFKANLRELYHFCRLRCDKHSQLEVRNLALKIERIIKQKAPLAAQMLCGKDEFNKCNG